MPLGPHLAAILRAAAQRGRRAHPAAIARVIVDFIGGEGHGRRLAQAAYCLHLGMRTLTGNAHDPTTIGAWCARAGLTRQRVMALEAAGGLLGAIVARRAS